NPSWSRRRRFVTRSLRWFFPKHRIKLDEDIIEAAFLTMAIVASGFRERLSPVFGLGTSVSEAEIGPAIGEAFGVLDRSGDTGELVQIGTSQPGFAFLRLGA